MYQRIRESTGGQRPPQAEMANELGMSQTGYSKYETGENDVPTVILKALAMFHGTSVDYLLDLTDEKAPYKRKQ